MKRRHFILGAAGVSGALLVGWGVMPPRSRQGKPGLLPLEAGEVALNGWLKIAADGAVVLAMPRSEMGQGVHTALPMLVAEELNMPLDMVRIEQAGGDAIYGNVAMLMGSLPFHPLDTEGPELATHIRATQWLVSKIVRELGINATGGSSTVADAWEPVRVAAATVGARLRHAAAQQWQVPLDRIRIEAGRVVGGARSAHFGELADAAAQADAVTVTLKPQSAFTLLGQPTPRTDIPSKVKGAAIFGIDVRVPGMVYAVARMAPTLKGDVASLNVAPATAVPGVLQVVQFPPDAQSAGGFAVVAKTTWQAKQGADKVVVSWSGGEGVSIDSTAIAAQLQAAVQAKDGFTFYEKGDVTTWQANAANQVLATYQAPYLAHATLEPMNCTAQLDGTRLKLWVPTQVPGMVKAKAAEIAGVELDQIDLVVTQLGGGFGRRLEVDFVAQAVRVAMAMPGQAVQLLWEREQDMRHDYYRPMHVAALSAGVGGDGVVDGLRIDSAGDAISPRWMARALPALSGPVDMPDKTTAEGLFDLPYGFEHQHMAHTATDSGVPVGFWRSVGHSHNAFFSESFIDELAHAAQKDPVAFRRGLLVGAPRYAAVLDMAARAANWGQELPAGQALGVALHESFGSIVAQVARVELLPNNSWRVLDVHCAIDCGVVVNPETVAQQMEGSVVFALTAMAYGQIDIANGAVQQANFPDYPMLKLSQTPKVYTHIVRSNRAPAGVGEPGVPPLAPAVSNALFALNKVRHRRLPIGGIAA
jgi:isoquinoline 1-oxidoreductase subunit beta